MPRLVSPVVPPGTLRSLPQPTVEAGQVILRPWRDDDAAAVVEAYADPQIQRWHVRSVDGGEALAQIRHWHAGWTAETDPCWAVSSSPGDQVLGRVALRGLSLPDGVAEVAYWVLPAARRQGVASSAVLALSGWAFGTLGLHRLALEHSVRNPASCRTALAAGFEVEGTARSSVRHADGWHDMHLHARISPGPG